MKLGRHLAIELVKFKVPVNYITFAIYVGLMVLFSALTVSETFGGIQVQGGTSNPDSTGVLSLQMSFLRLLLAVVIIVNIGKEFARGTVKKNLIDGLTRTQWYTGKLLASFVIYIAVFLFGVILYFVTGSLVEGIDKAYENYPIIDIARDFAVYFFYTAMIFGIAIITRNVSLGFVVYIFLSVLESIINFALQRMFGTEFNFLPFLPSGSASSLDQIPMEEPLFLLVTIAYFVLFIVVSFLSFTKKDLK
ncbi:ABC transporter permease subunit [Luteibaculum oceani]|uniref:ABC transporter permease subunit n=1 Tax=Luteibaculum oceani TaxID=1294296 RepID=UPI0014769234|nr:ABC transporter permease subunit [Luteibaculum oceani]